MKSDSDLKRDVEAELASDPQVKSNAVGVAVKDGVVTLTGHIETFAEKHAAEHALRRVTGVRAIALELDVKLDPSHRRSDTDIAQSAEQALQWNTSVPLDRLRITVDHGWATLRGELDWDYQRRAAEAAIRPLMGVMGISNEIVIKPKVSQGDLKHRIAAALGRQIERELKHIEIDVDGSKVTLRGKVNSRHERDAAQGVAWSAPGVRTVINELSVE